MKAKLKSISITNFVPFSGVPQTYQFPDDDVLVIGVNQDSSGANSNGSGKSSFLNAICYGITGEVLKDITVDKIIRPGQSSASVVLDLEISDGSSVIIQREREGKEKLLLTLKSKKGVQVFGKGTTASNIQTKLLEIFNLHPKKFFEDFLNTVYFSSSSLSGFASKTISNAERMALLTRFLNLGRFDLAVEQCKQMRKSYSDTLALVEARVSEILSNLPDTHDCESYDLAISSQLAEFNEAKVQWLEYKTSLEKLKTAIIEIEKIKSQIRELEALAYVNTANKNTEIDLLRQIDTIEENLKDTYAETNPEKEKQQLEETSITCNKRILELNSLTTTLSNSILDIEKQILNPYTCPSCEASLIIHQGSLHTVDIKKINELKKHKIAKQEELIKLRTELKEEKEKKSQVDEKIKEYIKWLAELKELENRLNYLTKDLERIRKNIIDRDFNSEIELLNQSIPDVEVPEDLMNQLESAETELANINESIGSLREIKRNIIKWKEELNKYSDELEYNKAFIEKYSLWIKLFPQIKQAIIENYLPIFEDRVNYYLNFLGTGFSVRLLTERETKSKTIKQEFSILVTDSTGIEREYETFSEGEMRRIAVCVGFALRDVALSRNSLPFDFLLIDEIVDGLDEVGINEFFRLIKSIPGQKLIVSHSDDFKARFSNVLTIQKKGGVSTIFSN